MSKNYFQNSVVVVTGAASGIGRQLCLQLIEKNARVVACDINLKGLEETKSFIPKEKQENITTKTLDVADKNAVKNFAESVLKDLKGEKLILINNAGVALFTGSFEDTTLEDIEWLFNINFWGVVALTKAFYHYFLKQNEGHIVNVSSVFGLGGFAFQNAYSPSKFAVRGFTETLRMELLETKIITTSVHPGGIKTNITKNSKVSEKLKETQGEVNERFSKMAKTTPEKAAATIIKGIENKKQRILIGTDAYLIDFITRLFPVRYSKLAVRGLERVFSNPYKILERKKK